VRATRQFPWMAPTDTNPFGVRMYITNIRPPLPGRRGLPRETRTSPWQIMQAVSRYGCRLFICIQLGSMLLKCIHFISGDFYESGTTRGLGSRTDWS
jgi:hypothetical protein